MRASPGVVFINTTEMRQTSVVDQKIEESI